MEEVLVKSPYTIERDDKGRFVKGVVIVMSPEVREKISTSRKGIKFTDEHKKKLSEAKKGKTTWNKGISHSKESREKMSIAHIGRTLCVPCHKTTDTYGNKSKLT